MRDTARNSGGKGDIAGSEFLQSVIYVLLWYGSSVCCVTTSKTIITQLPFPFLLCTIQFFCACIAASLYLKAANRWKLPSKAMLRSITGISLSYSFGFVTLNTALLTAAASFVETVRAAEAFTTVVMGYFMLHESIPFRVCMTLFPICGGVAVSCVSGHSGFSLLGLVFAFLSNLCFSIRSVAAKHYVQLFKEAALDQINLFNVLSALGLCFLIPLTMIVEGRAIVDYLHLQIDTQQQNQQHPPQQQWLPSDAEALSFFAVLIFNGCMFACYNLMSYIMLQRTDLVTHAVLNVFRRVFSIFVTAVYFRMGMTMQNAMGVSIAISGVMMFGYFRSSRAKQQQQQQQQQLEEAPITA